MPDAPDAALKQWHPAWRRELSHRYRLQRWATGLAWLLLTGLLAGLLVRVSGSARAALAAAAGPGFLAPVGLALVAAGVAYAVRRSAGRARYRLQGSELVMEPGPVAALLGRGKPTRVDLGGVRWQLPVRTHFGAFWALGSERDGVQLPLGLVGAREVLAQAQVDLAQGMLDPAAFLDESARGGPSEPVLRHYETAGCWQLAAGALWARLLDAPRDYETALRLYRVERHRLTAIRRLQLLEILCPLHPAAVPFWLDEAGLTLALKLRARAREALERLAELDDAPEVASRWRDRFEGRKGLPAPTQGGAFGFEIRPTGHSLDDGQLVVDGRYKIPLDWFVGFRVPMGFLGPQRVELFDLWGGRQIIHRDAMVWVTAILREAPHLTELHDQSLVAVGAGRYIRRLRALTRGE